MTLPLHLIIDRTGNGKLRAEVAGQPEFAVEAADFTRLLDAVRDTFLTIVSGEPGGFERNARDSVAADAATPVEDVERALTDEEDREMRRLAMDKMPDPETLKSLVSRQPVPDHWPEGDEDWDDAP
jgi:hypothetical protein